MNKTQKYIVSAAILALIAGGLFAWQNGWFSIIKRQVKENETAIWKIYQNKTHGFVIAYPPSYAAEQEECPPKSPSPYDFKNYCAVKLRLKVSSTFEYSDNLDGYFYLLEDIRSVQFSDQTSVTYFDPNQNAWMRRGGDLATKAESVWGYTAKSGKEILAFNEGGSHGAYTIYLIPDYQKGYGAVFEIPVARRVRCDLLEDSTQQRQCVSSLDSLKQKYKADNPYDWLPEAYLEDLHKGARQMVKSFEFIDSSASPKIPGIVITSPKGGEQWRIGESHEIIWNVSSYPANSEVLITLLGKAVDTIIKKTNI